MNSIYSDTVELLLKSMSCQAGGGLQTSFMFGNPEARRDHHIGIPGLSLVGCAARDIPE